MDRWIRWTLVPLILLVVGGGGPAVTTADGPARPGETPLACDPDQQQASGAWYRICMPPALLWNGDLVVYAHGYVSPLEPVSIPEEQMTLPGGIPVADVVNAMGYAFATTSYSTNGLAVRQGLADLVDLVDRFTIAKGAPDRVLLVGVSEGGLITTLAVEQHAGVFDGGLAMCGPYGDFADQIDHIADHRVVFDYFFPALMPPSPVEVPDWLLLGWEDYYTTTIQPQIQDPANVGQVDQLLSVTQAAYDPADLSTKEDTIYDLLRYNAMATNDAQAKLGGQPFDNQERVYAGSTDDIALNAGVQRFSADPAALDEVEAYYQTSGQLSVPLVMLHTTGDPLVPYWHAPRYRVKTIGADNIALHELRTVERYGHCNFVATEVLDAFNRLVEMVDDPPPYQPVQRIYLPSIARLD